MVKKLRIKFSIFATLSIFLLLSIILLSINIANFSLVAKSADDITSVIEQNGGRYNTNPNLPRATINLYYAPNEGGNNIPDSPEMRDSLRYFTYKFDPAGHITEIEYKISTYSKQEAEAWAMQLLNDRTPYGWSRTYYRFRIFSDKDKNNYVTVIDQSRELVPCYNVMYASIIGSSVGLVVVAAAMLLLSKRLIRPFLESDNKQKRFIANAALTLRTPLSVMAVDNATLKNENGITEANKSLDKQISKLFDLANDLNSFSVLDGLVTNKIDFNMANVTKEVASRFANGFKASKKELTLNLDDSIILNADKQMFEKMLSEIFENLLKYSDSYAKVELFKENDRNLMVFTNDAKGIPSGSLDRVFDRFYRLDYKDHSQYEGHGVGLAIVKEIIDQHHARVSAKGEDDKFILKIEF